MSFVFNEKHSVDYHPLQTFHAQYYFPVLDSTAEVIADIPI